MIYLIAFAIDYMRTLLVRFFIRLFINVGALCMCNPNTNNQTEDVNEITDLDRLTQVFKICLDICRAYKLYKEYRNSFEDNNDNRLIGNALLDFCLLNILKILYTQTESMKLCKLFQRLGYDYATVKNDFLRKLNMDETQYKIIFDNLKVWRDKIVAHFDYDFIADKSVDSSCFAHIPVICQSLSESAIIVFEKYAQEHQEQQIKFNDRNVPISFHVEQMKKVLETLYVNFQCSYDSKSDCRSAAR